MARTDCTCAVLERERFLESVQSNPELAGRIISYFAQELRAYDDMMASPSEEADAADEEARLYELAGHFLKQGAGRRTRGTRCSVYQQPVSRRAHARGGHSKRLASVRRQGRATAAARARGACAGSSRTAR